MKPEKAFLFSNTVLILCIISVNVFLYYFWSGWHTDISNEQNNYSWYMIWVSLPFSLLLITNFFIKNSSNALLFITFSALFLVGIMLVNYYYYMAVLSDGSSGLIFIVLPFLQLTGTLVVIIVATILNSVKRND